MPPLRGYHAERRRIPYLIEKLRSTRVTLPCLSATEIVNLPRSSFVSGFASVHSQTPCDFAWNFDDKFSPGGTSSSVKSAVTWKRHDQTEPFGEGAETHELAPRQDGEARATGGRAQDKRPVEPR